MDVTMIRHLFVYGTLQPGEVRWGFLSPFVVDEGWRDSVAGSLFDTGLEYPAALFDGSARVHGRTFALLETSIGRCLDVLDLEEDTVGGEYRRVAVTTAMGVVAWAYEYGQGLDLAPIPSGDWLMR